MDRLELATMRADEADRIINSEVFKAAFDDVKAAILSTWADLPTADTENAKDLHRRLKCLEQVKRALVEHVATGKLAKKEIEGRTSRALSLHGLRNALSRN